MVKRISFSGKNTCKAVCVSALAALLTLTGCSSPTGTAGNVSYFTEGVITDIEVIDIDLNKYNHQGNAAIGAAAGAGIGQIIGKDSESTLIGAGIGLLAGLAASNIADRVDGMRLTVSTNQGLILLDQPYSCNFRKGAKIRMINSSKGNGVQVQVLTDGRYVTATKNAKTDCPVR